MASISTLKANDRISFVFSDIVFIMDLMLWTDILFERIITQGFPTYFAVFNFKRYAVPVDVVLRLNIFGI